MNSCDPKYSVTGTSVAMDKNAYYLVADDFRKTDIYIKFDVYQRTNYSEIGINTAENVNGFMRIGTNNDEFPYLEMIMRQETLYLQRVGKNGDRDNIMVVPHMEQFNNELVTFEIHIDTANSVREPDLIELWINNIKYGTKDDTSYFDDAQILTLELNHGMPSAIAEGMNGYTEYSYFSNIIVGDVRLSNKKCMVLPTKIISSTWEETDGKFVATDKGQSIVQQIDMEKLNEINPIYDNTVIDAIMCGGDLAYSEGYNNMLRYSVDDTEFDVKSLANKPYYGVQTKILEKNPATNDYWTREVLEKVKFTVTSDDKN